MANTATLAIKIVGDARSATKAMAETSSKASRMGSAMKTAAKVGVLAVGVAAVGAAKGLYDMAKAAAEDQASAAQLANTLKRATGATKTQVKATEDFISSMGKAFGVADDDLRPAIARLAVSTKDLQKAQSLSVVAMNVAAGTGRSLKSVTDAIAKAQNGSLGGLARLGVATKNQAGETKSLDAVMADLANTYAGSASTAANTLEGQQKRLGLRFSELKESIGAKLLPVLSRFTGFLLDKVAPAAEELGQKLARKLGPTIKSVARFITGTLVPAVQSLITWFIEKLVPGIVRTVTPILEGLRKMFEKVRAKIAENEPQLSKLREFLKRVVEFIYTKVMPILGKLSGEGFKILGDAIGVVIDIISTFIDVIDKAVDGVKKLVDLVKNIDLPDIGGVVGAINPFGRAAVVGGGGDSFVVNINGGFVDDATLDRLERAFDRRARRRAS